jgi:hypothetical protein
MGIKLTDMDKVEAWSGGAMLGPGTHNVTIERADEGKSSGGHDQVELEFVSNAGAGSIRDWLVFTPATLGKARQLLDAVGIEAQSGEWEFPTAKIVGRKLEIMVNEVPHYDESKRAKGETQRKVTEYRTPGSGDGVPGDTNGLGPASASDDDIPF